MSKKTIIAVLTTAAVCAITVKVINKWPTAKAFVYG